MLRAVGRGAMSGQSGFQLEDRAANRYEEFVAPIMAPFVAAILEAVAPRPGEALLDLACGTGFVARAAARQVGHAGYVAGADVNASMLGVAARHSAGAPGLIEWVQAPADALPFDDDRFDAVVCQQGLQFFPVVQAAVSEAARVMRVGGRFAATVWSARERSPYFDAQYAAIAEVAGADAVASLAQAMGYDPARLRDAMAVAGFTGVHVREVVADISLPRLPDFSVSHLEAIPWGVVAAQARPDGVAVVGARVAELLEGRTAADGSATLPFASMMVSGTKAG